MEVRLGEQNECTAAIDDQVREWFPILSGTPSFVSDPSLQCPFMGTLKGATQKHLWWEVSGAIFLWSLANERGERVLEEDAA